jgi:hypothetical protein
MTAYLKQAPAGYPGDITRTDESNVESAKLVALSTVYPSSFGVPMKYVAGGIQQIATSDTAPVFAGILVREVPGITGSSVDDAVFDPTSPYSKQVQGLLVRGYCIVKVFAGTPARGGVVYMQVTANAGAVPGDLRADGTDSGNAVALTATQAEWASDGKDTFNNAEIRVAR